MSYHLPAGFNPFPNGYTYQEPMKRGYYPPPPHYGQNGYGYGTPSQIFQMPEVVNYINELNQTSSDDDTSSNNSDCEQVETFVRETSSEEEEESERADETSSEEEGESERADETSSEEEEEEE